MNNSVFAKTMDNVRRHKNIELVTNKESHLKTVMKHNFKLAIYFSENLMGFKMGRLKLLWISQYTLAKPYWT